MDMLRNFYHQCLSGIYMFLRWSRFKNPMHRYPTWLQTWFTSWAGERCKRSTPWGPFTLLPPPPLPLFVLRLKGITKINKYLNKSTENPTIINCNEHRFWVIWELWCHSPQGATKTISRRARDHGRTSKGDSFLPPLLFGTVWLARFRFKPGVDISKKCLP